MEGTHNDFPHTFIFNFFVFHSICAYRSHNIYVISAESTTLQIPLLFHNIHESFCSFNIVSLPYPFLQTPDVDFKNLSHILQILHKNVYLFSFNFIFHKNCRLSGWVEKRRGNVYFSFRTIKKKSHFEIGFQSWAETSVDVFNLLISSSIVQFIYEHLIWFYLKLIFYPTLPHRNIPIL